ncbi:Endonuclease/exonuclease/phosphatase [Gongronella butleri]|nr:Endonuclease/exonuclease/phosphatase [Gongronella butleri]
MAPPLDAATIEKRRQEKRALRAAKKEQQQDQNTTQAQDTMAIPFQRAWQTLAPRLTRTGSASCTIMSYNVLAQALCQRELFPHAGKMLKWKTRRTMVMDEIAYYRPELMCLQEVDNYDVFYKEALEKLGYATTYHQHESKRQGCVIAYQADAWEQVAYRTVDLDTDASCPPTMATGNVAQLMALATRDKHPRRRVLLGNTHLYWRPPSTYERCRQGLIYQRRLWDMHRELTSSENDENGKKADFTPVLCGDFNTQPSDPLYALLTGAPLSEYQRLCMEVTRRAFDDDDHDYEPDATPGATPPPNHASDDNKTLLTLDQLVDALGPRPGEVMQSAYKDHGQYYKEHVRRYGSNEPDYTIYAHVFKGTLDYILVPEHTRVLRHLQLPPMDKLAPAIPNDHFGSDHVALVADIDLDDIE